jgi:hypothetical protein
MRFWTYGILACCWDASELRICRTRVTRMLFPCHLLAVRTTRRSFMRTASRRWERRSRFPREEGIAAVLSVIASLLRRESEVG